MFCRHPLGVLNQSPFPATGTVTRQKRLWIIFFALLTGTSWSFKLYPELSIISTFLYLPESHDSRHNPSCHSHLLPGPAAALLDDPVLRPQVEEAANLWMPKMHSDIRNHPVLWSDWRRYVPEAKAERTSSGRHSNSWIFNFLILFFSLRSFMASPCR